MSQNSKINLIHRRDGFSGAQASVDKVKELEKEGKINLFTQYQINSIKGGDSIESVSIKHDEGEIKELKTDYVLGFFGLIMQLGPILDWGLNLNKKTIEVDTEKFETNQPGIHYWLVFLALPICIKVKSLSIKFSGFKALRRSITNLPFICLLKSSGNKLLNSFHSVRITSASLF